MTTKLTYLSEHPVFGDLSDEELLALSQIAHEYSFQESAVIAYQRDVADAMYIVKSGRLFARQVDNQGIVRQANTRQYGPGDFFGTDWLFNQGTHPATVTGSHDGQLLIIKGDAFRQFLINNPNVIHRLQPLVDEEGEWYGGLTISAWDHATKLPLIERRERIGSVRLLPDELLEYYSRRSSIVLLEAMLWPVLGLTLIPLLAYFLIPSTSTVLQVTKFGLMAVAVVLFMGMIIIRLLDWRNDYFVITNKHISHREFELRTFRTELNKIPINQVQSVTVERPTLLANIFDIGNVRITTASNLGTIIFDGIENPREVEDVLNRLRLQVRDLDEAMVQTDMRESVESHFQINSGVQPVSNGEDDDRSGSSTTTERQTFWQRFLRLFDWRVEEDGVITYRRNYLILFWDLFLPIMVLGILFAVGYLVYRYIYPDMWIIFLVMVPFIFIIMAWLVWRYEDWANDMFQLTDRDIIDIDRKPFGFGESRKQAPLRNIQNVRAERPGFFATLFDYGYVYIETAGAQSDIIFDKIPRPSVVLSDIFRRLDDFREAQRRREGDTRRGEYAVLLDVYKQEMEQGRIPQRTPRD